MAASVMPTSATKPAVEGKGKLMDNLSNYIIVDIGANLTNKKFSRDLDQVIQRATDSGVSKIMVTGTSLHSTKEALRLTRLYPDILYSTAGDLLLIHLLLLRLLLLIIHLLLLYSSAGDHTPTPTKTVFCAQ